MTHLRHRTGFTLIEIIVALMMVALLTATVAVNLAPDDTDLLREETERLAWTLERAGDEARRRGQVIGFAIHQGDYAFYYSSDGYSWEEINDGPLARGRLNHEVIAKRANQGGLLLAAEERILFLPGGDSPLFSLTLSREGKRQSLWSTPLGVVESGNESPV